ncbi:efflux RND transporter periplasmic adaptor subunit [Vibrio sp. SCSIO 43135]|uniref:Efflux RND transporter periplasmic adaptor subunit n=1 Tax=Vibrio paucivorans TaxID=2829489 RepID=A0A9X3HP49_9VIBR|nr:MULTISPECIES: efflux RND transporter periplasmic adaptor subunit [Vibrio]MCW8332620.1 efflux RND transporter periplasmic adaptor subunit [Vibrio paucivorans]USD41820.1 efflux RND transporter periplasmic adaptor subunit [Vibrio sp. SCSIO 43135]
MKNNKLTSLLALSILIATPSVHAKRPQGPQAVTVITEQVQTHQVSQSLSLVGKLEADESVVISSEVTGKVDKIAIRANQVVQKGQLLVQLDDDKAQAALAEAKAYLNDQQRILKEFERLLKRGAITQTEIDAQKASVEIADARLTAAEANLKDLHITAPFSGTVGFIDFSRGKFVSVGDDLLTLDNLSVMQLDLQVPERYLSKISQGMAVTATTSAWGDMLFTGEVVGIDSRINQETLNLRVRIHFDNGESKLKPGMLVSSNMAFPPIEAPIIPVQALEYSGTKRYVYVVDETNKAARTEVFLGARIGNEVVIESGLEIGEKIVVQGIVNMRDGVTVAELNKDGTLPEKEIH